MVAGFSFNKGSTTMWQWASEHWFLSAALAFFAIIAFDNIIGNVCRVFVDRNQQREITIRERDKKKKDSTEDAPK